MRLIALVNARCGSCEVFRPRCAHVFLRVLLPGGGAGWKVTYLCEDCRKLYRGMYRAHARHVPAL